MDQSAARALLAEMDNAREAARKYMRARDLLTGPDAGDLHDRLLDMANAEYRRACELERRVIAAMCGEGCAQPC